MSVTAMLAGFEDPVLDAQRVFRSLLDALARPGTVQVCPAPGETPPGMPPAMAALALTLADSATAVWLSPAHCAAADYLRFHCGCPINAAAEAPGAAFAFAAADEAPPLAGLTARDEAAPETSTTLVLNVAAVDQGRGYRLSGPGIETEHHLHCAGLPQDFAAAWQDNRARYPCGTDVFLVAGCSVVGLPRSLTIEEDACTSR